MMKKKSILLNADDFGRHPAINQAVARAVRGGILRSASLMAGEPAFEEAVELARSLPNLEIGIHLTLVDGKPLLPREDVPSLIGADGRFYPSHREFVRAYLSGRIHLEEVRLELSAQFQRIMQEKLRVTHVDSHQHVHILPGIFPIVLKLAQSYRIRSVRIPQAAGGIRECLAGGSAGDRMARFGLWLLCCRMRQKAVRYGFYFPDHFIGLIAGGAVDEAFLMRQLENLPDGLTEIMIHPGLDNTVLSDCYAHRWEHDFEGEYRCCLSSRIAEFLRGKEIGLGSFRAGGSGL